MALQKQPIDISFAGGLDLKTDPKRVPIGKFTSLKNTIFTKAGMLQKRNGFQSITDIPDNGINYLSTFNNDLVATSASLFYSYDAPNQTWNDKSTFYPCTLSTVPLVRSTTSQLACDAAVSANGLICVAYSDQNTSVLTSTIYKYAIFDAATGQNVLPATSSWPATPDSQPQVYIFQGYFIIVYSSSGSLEYVVLSSSSLQQVATGTFSGSSTGVFSCLSANNRFYIAYATDSGGGTTSITLAYIEDVTAGIVDRLVISTSPNLPAGFTLCVDSANIYASYYLTTGNNDIYYLAAALDLKSIATAPTLIRAGSSSVVPFNIISAVTGGVLYVIFGSLNPSIGTYLTDVVKVQTSNGNILTSSPIKRSVAPASKAIVLNGRVYFLSFFPSSYQPTLFLLDHTGGVISKLAYSNASINGSFTPTFSFNYIPTFVWNVSVTNNTISIPYLVKTQVTPVNKTTGATSVGGLFNQLGVNLSAFTVGDASVASVEASKTLNLSGGFPWSYDGVQATEQTFFTWPDTVGVSFTASSAVTTTGSATRLTYAITVASSTGIYPGMTVSDGTSSGNVQANTKVLSVSGTQVVVDKVVTTTFVGDSLTFQGNLSAQSGGTNTKPYYYVAVYAYQDNQGNVYRSAPSIPVAVSTTGTGVTGYNSISVATDRLTYKTNPAAKIEIYRWSVAQPIYYQVTSVQYPTLNDPSVDFITFIDPYSEADIAGNLVLYTTGGVLENIQGPPSSIITLFQSRFWMVDAENTNTLWFSKQIIQAAPIEMNDSFTFFVSPTVGTQGDTGPITALSPLDDKLIIFKKNAIYYINGVGPDNTGVGNQYSEPIFVTATLGCDNPKSIVFMPNGIIFQSDKGLWLLGRDLSTQYIGAPVETLMQGATVVAALSIPETTQVRFSLDTGVTLMYDYFYSTWSEFTGIPHSSATLYRGNQAILYVPGSGSVSKVKKETPGYYQDGSTPVLMSFTTSWISLAGLQGFERFYQCYLLGEYISPFKLNFKLAYDYNTSNTQSTIITPQGYAEPWGDDPLWGSSTPWGGMNGVFRERVFPDKQKCETFRVQVDELFDRSFGVAQAGAGLTLSGLLLLVGTKRASRTQSAGRSI